MTNLYYIVRYIVFFILMTLFAAYANADSSDTPVRSRYDISVRLDTATKTLTASTQLTWTNPDTKPVDHMLFHMYYNAFKNSKSTFFLEDQFPDLRPDLEDDCYWSYIDILNIVDDAGTDLSRNIQYVQPDDDNLDDQSVLRVNLESPVQPNETMTLNFDWESKIPNIMPRTGYNQEYYFLAQWFPKLGVYETEGMRYSTEGNWNCHQYHANGEYYGEFADYSVTMTVPDGFVVASSGKLEEKKSFDSASTSWTFVCDNVIDFTWSTSPHFVVQNDKFKDTDILFYTYPYKQEVASRYFNSVKYCMNYLDDKLGDYPYPTLSIVDPPIHGLFTGGMEYPTLVTSLSLTFFPDGFRTPETLVMHEFIHQYFMQMVASHEVEEPWLDEGFTTYWEGRILDELLGETTSMIDFLGLGIGTKEYNRYEFLNSKYNTSAPATSKSYEFENLAYGPISYNKTALWLQTLERMIGRDLMDLIWKTYFERWQYRHPCGDDFKDVVNELVSIHSDQFQDGMDWFFDQVISGTGLCDYEIYDITNTNITNPNGFLSTDSNCTEATDSQDFLSKVKIRRNEAITIPQLVEVYFEDGTIVVDTIDTEEQFSTLSYNTQAKITKAIIDPDTLIYLDKNLLNNTYTLHNEHNGANSKINTFFQAKLQNLLELLAAFI